VNENEENSDNHLPEKQSHVFQKLSAVRDAAVAKAERQYLIDLMAHTQQDMKKAIRISGLSQSRLYSLIKKYRLSRS
jgi:DNA-binding NtrC family response regulator